MKTILSCLLGALAVCVCGFIIKTAFFSAPSHTKPNRNKEVATVIYSENTVPQYEEKTVDEHDGSVFVPYDASVMDSFRTDANPYKTQIDITQIEGLPYSTTNTQISVQEQEYGKQGNSSTQAVGETGVSFNDGTILYSGYVTDSAYDSGDCVVLFFEYENKSQDQRSYFTSGISIKAYQNGVELDITRPANVWYSEITYDATEIGANEKIIFARVHKTISNEPIEIRYTNESDGTVLNQFSINQG